jgi:Zn-finger nucleic acid-binding protein
MQCPVCEVQLSISARDGVEIDFCPQCRGVWLDRGELDKIIQRASTMDGAGSDFDDRRQRSRYDDDRRRDYDDRRRDYDDDRRRDYDYDDRRRHDDDYRHGKKRKRGGFLEDLFDFG